MNIGIRKLLAISCILASFTVSAQLKLDAPGVRLLEQYEMLRKGVTVDNPDLRLVGDLKLPQGGIKALSTKDAEKVGENIVGAIVNFVDGTSADQLELHSGIKISNEIYPGCVTMFLPISELEWLIAQPQIRLVSLGYEQKPTMVNARPSGLVTPVQEGSEGLDKPYDGTGIIVGMFDTGMDPNHINFTEMGNPAASRVTRVWSYTGGAGELSDECTTPEAIAKFTTDMTNETHGTHVMGIAAGAYNGPGSWRNNRAMIETDKMPLYGVATNSEIVMAGGRLYTASILDGVKRQIDYAELAGKPIVMNLSLGSLLGPHDGTDASSIALAKLGERAIICIAAGNDGDKKCAFNMQGGGLQATSLRNTVGMTNYISGDEHRVQIWNDKSDPFVKFEFIIFDTNTHTAVYTKEITGTSSSIRLGGSSTGSSYEKPGEVFDQAFSEKGYININAFTNGGNSRYVADIAHKLYAGENPYYKPCFRITRSRGQWVYGISDGGEFTNYSQGSYTDNGVNYAAFTNGTNNGSVSSMSTGENVLVVGAYTSAVNFGLLSQGGYSYNGHTEIDEICSFSSYGKNVATNASLPDVSAPGSAILSSFNSYWKPSGGIYSESSGTAAYNGVSYYWGPMQGTSMATPFVTGVVALWLEADPTLNVADIKNVINLTSYKNTQYNNGGSELKMQWGAGQLDALVGIKYILDNRAAIGTVFADDDSRLVVTSDGGRVTAHVSGATRVEASLFSVSGRAVTAARGADEAVVVTENLPAGIYILSVESSEGRFARKITVK